MNKDQAVEYMIDEIEKIERERLASRPNVDATKMKREVVDQILKKLEEVQIDDENKSDQV